MPDAQPTRTEISQLGEFGLIRRIASRFDGFQQPSTKVGMGDDAAIMRPPAGQELVLSSDMLVEGFHFDLAFHPLHLVGYKAVIVNLSDVAAMNVLPTQFTVNLGLSNRFSVEAVDAFYTGVKAACEQYKVDLVGGDTTGSPQGLLISVSAWGFGAPEKIVRRSGAKPGDILCVTGDLGAAYAGLQILLREKEVYKANPDMQPELQGFDYLIQRSLKPEARVDLVHELAERGIVPTSMIDISDGLSSEVLHLCTESGTESGAEGAPLGAVLYEDKIPVDEETYRTCSQTLKIDPITAALNGGDDYELLFTIAQADYPKLKNHPDVHFIGYLDAAGNGQRMLTKGGQTVPLQAQGWNHFQADQE